MEMTPSVAELIASTKIAFTAPVKDASQAATAKLLRVLKLSAESDF
jgi:hypothetical protein